MHLATQTDLAAAADSPATHPDDFMVYSEGLMYCSVCTSLSAEDATERLNADHPSGTSGGWKISDKSFATGEPNPCPCRSRLATHKHFLFNC